MAEFVQLCREHGIKPVAGIEFRDNGRLLYIGIAQNQEGFKALNTILTSHLTNGAALPRRLDQVTDAFIIYPDRIPSPERMRSHEFVGLTITNLRKKAIGDVQQEPGKVVLLHTINHADRMGWQVHKLLQCIDQGLMLSQVSSSGLADPGQTWLEQDSIADLKIRYGPIMLNTEKLLDQCQISFETLGPPNRRSFTAGYESDKSLLLSLTSKGLARRYPDCDLPLARSRLEHELNIIFRLQFASYYLVVWDMLRHARSSGYPYVGRGSGGNSIAAYCLMITHVEPIELGLHFERFLNSHRLVPPDFDIDFSWKHRDKVLSYLIASHGSDRTALLASYNTFKGKSIVRELGKVFGLNKREIDQIIQHPLQDNHHPHAHYIFAYGRLLERMPNYLSVHSGGVIIAEEALDNYTARQMMPKGMPITHCDMRHAELLGFHKFDVLSQRGLGHIEQAVQLVKSRHDKQIPIDNVHQIKQDPRTLQQLYSGECIGCFYIESPAMRGLLHKMKCSSYLDLVAASSIIRPGVAKSGMMRSYLRRRMGQEEPTYLHPVMEQKLGETFGIMVYQEDVMQVVTAIAGFEAREADMLRRLMTGKEKSKKLLASLRSRFLVACQLQHMPNMVATELWRQISSFSGYSFCKAHSASYAAESFQSLYLKAHFPLEFITAVINNGGGFYPVEIYVHEARRLGVSVVPPCINRGGYQTTIVGDHLVLGWKHVKGLRSDTCAQLISVRQNGGPFRNLWDMMNRLHLPPNQIALVVRIGGARFTKLAKGEILLRWLTVSKKGYDQSADQMQLPWGASSFPRLSPTMAHGPDMQAMDEQELLGFTLKSPFSLLAEHPQDGIRAGQMKLHENRTMQIVGYFVIRKPVTTNRHRHMCFATWLDLDGEYFDSVHFPKELKTYPFEGKGSYLLTGRVVIEHNYPILEVKKMRRIRSRIHKPHAGDMLSVSPDVLSGR